MLYCHQSNRLEILVDRLADVLRQPLRTPLAPELVITPSNGLARWLALRLADRLGVCANLSVQFPATFLWEISRALLRGMPSVSAFERPVLRWRLLELLGALDDTPCLAPLHAWLGDGRDDFRRYQLACRIADCFDQYLVYRPDWIRTWERDAPDHWQAALWQRLTAAGAVHRVQIQEQLRAALRTGNFARNHLPERVAVLGVTTLPPLYLDLLAELANVIDVHLLLLNPCQEYWGDIRAERDLARLDEEIDPEEAYLVVGNPLLASLGKQGRDFIDLLQNYPRTEWDGFAEPAGDSLLHHLQADILHLRERGSADCPPLPLRADDRSLQIHACHGPMREVEVLHDQLLALFAADPRLKSSDVVVMAPDIAVYGPLIEAVFDSVPRERRIPFSVADQGVAVENPLVEVFFTLLDLGGGRFDAVQVLDLLEAPALRRRFDLAEEDVIRIRHWVRSAGIRWGIDAETKQHWDLPATAEHTWRTGLDRLLLGYALPGEGRGLYQDILPCDEVEGSAALALGGLESFTEALFGLDARLREQRPLTAWLSVLRTVLEQFFDPREREENELQQVRAALEALGDTAEQAGFGEPLSLAVVKSALREQLNSVASGAGRFLGGGVTCCAMVPMRSIPFAVVCLLGLNDDAYPRPHPPPGFDLMANRFRRGDRARHQDDRYLFLETLLSARQCLYLSYCGQNIRDNARLPPSVLVSELLDVVDRAFYSANSAKGVRPSAQLLTRHPLQPFSRRYFTDDARLFSYADEWVEASRQAGRGEREATVLLSGALPEAEPALRLVSLETLVGFFKNPARWLLRERLGVRVDDDEVALETREPFVLNSLAAYQLAEQALELYRDGEPPARIATLLRAGGVLPHGEVGACVAARTQERVLRFAGELGRLLPRRAAEPLPLDVVLGDFRLIGPLAGLTPAGWIGYRMAQIKAPDYLQLWLHHLALNALDAQEAVEVPRCSRWIGEGRDQQVILEPLSDAADLLTGLLDIYWQGTQRLLHFFPKSALVYIENMRKKGGSAEKALQAARFEWRGSERNHNFPERDNPYYRLAFGDSDPLDAEFEQLTMSVLGPLFALIDRTKGQG